jgi:KUP system potassium uptake protein
MRSAFLVGALGVVYGDIGTSPIYTFKECLKASGGDTSADVVLGVVSLIFWSLIIVVTGKYVFVVMRADNQDEGGIIALLGLAAHTETDQKRRTALLLVGVAVPPCFTAME